MKVPVALKIENGQWVMSVPNFDVHVQGPNFDVVRSEAVTASIVFIQDMNLEDGEQPDVYDRSYFLKPEFEGYHIMDIDVDLGYTYEHVGNVLNKLNNEFESAYYEATGSEEIPTPYTLYSNGDFFIVYFFGLPVYDNDNHPTLSRIGDHDIEWFESWLRERMLDLKQAVANL